MSSFTNLMAESRESVIQRDCVKTFNLLGFWTWSLSQPRATMQTAGLSDFIAVGRGRVVFVEVKRKRGKQSAEQKQFQAHVEGNGGHYLLVREAADVVRFVESLPKAKREA